MKRWILDRGAPTKGMPPELKAGLGKLLSVFAPSDGDQVAVAVEGPGQSCTMSTWRWCARCGKRPLVELDRREPSPFGKGRLWGVPTYGSAWLRCARRTEDCWGKRRLVASALLNFCARLHRHQPPLPCHGLLWPYGEDAP